MGGGIFTFRDTRQRPAVSGIVRAISRLLTMRGNENEKEKIGICHRRRFCGIPRCRRRVVCLGYRGAIAVVGAGVAALGYLLASEQEDEADDCRRTNSGGGSLVCLNQGELDDRVDTWETVGIVGLAGVGIGGIMYLSDTAAAAGFTGIKSVMDRHIHSIRYTADKENLMKLSYHSPDVSGMVLSYSGIKGFGLSKEWAF